MPIPALNEDGFLPPGVHQCTLEEVRARFGAFFTTERRPRLFAELVEFVAQIQRADMFVALLLDGSFVTDKATPNDIDLVLVLRAGHDFKADLRPDQYNLFVAQSVLRRRGLDAAIAMDQSEAYIAAAEFFQRIRDDPARMKGILRVTL